MLSSAEFSLSTLIISPRAVKVPFQIELYVKVPPLKQLLLSFKRCNFFTALILPLTLKYILDKSMLPASRTVEGFASARVLGVQLGDRGSLRDGALQEVPPGALRLLVLPRPTQPGKNIAKKTFKQPCM